MEIFFWQFIVGCCTWSHGPPVNRHRNHVTLENPLLLYLLAFAIPRSAISWSSLSPAATAVYHPKRGGHPILYVDRSTQKRSSTNSKKRNPNLFNQRRQPRQHFFNNKTGSFLDKSRPSRLQINRTNLVAKHHSLRLHAGPI